MNIKNQSIESPFQLIKTFISDLSFSNGCLDYDATAAGERTINVGYKILKSNRTENGGFLALLALTLEINTTTDAGTFTLKAVIQGVFTGDGKQLDSDSFTNLLKINGCSALYSILRGSVSSITSQAFSSGNIIIPLVNFIRFHEIESASDE